MRNRGGLDRDLDELFQAYREACPDPEPGANFMPQLWQRIEARQTFSYFLGRMASGFVTAAVALTLMMAAYLYMPQSSGPFYSQTYVEALADSHVTAENTVLFEPLLADNGDTAGKL